MKLKINTDGFEGYAKRALGAGAQAGSTGSHQAGDHHHVRGPTRYGRGPHGGASPAGSESANKILVDHGAGGRAEA